MLYEVLIHLRNLFPKESYFGTWEVKDGGLSLPLSNGQYFLIEGSVFNDGVHEFPSFNLHNETFTGTITALAIPFAVIELVKDIEEYVKNNPAGSYTSESFGGYSYSKATDKNGAPLNWHVAFKERLDTWRKI